MRDSKLDGIFHELVVENDAKEEMHEEPQSPEEYERSAIVDNDQSRKEIPIDLRGVIAAAKNRIGFTGDSCTSSLDSMSSNMSCLFCFFVTSQVWDRVDLESKYARPKDLELTVQDTILAHDDARSDENHQSMTEKMKRHGADQIIAH